MQGKLMGLFEFSWNFLMDSFGEVLEADDTFEDQVKDSLKFVGGNYRILLVW